MLTRHSRATLAIAAAAIAFAFAAPGAVADQKISPKVGGQSLPSAPKTATVVDWFNQGAPGGQSVSNGYSSKVGTHSFARATQPFGGAYQDQLAAQKLEDSR